MPTSSYEKECDSKRIESVRVYQPKLAVGGGGGVSSSSGDGSSKPCRKNPRRNIKLYNVLFLLAYLFQMGWVITTIGDPYRQFLEKADREGFQGKKTFATLLSADPSAPFQYTLSHTQLSYS